MSRLVELEMMGEKPLVRGQFFFRDANADHVKLPPGMKLMMVCGVLAVPENFPVPGENMVRVRGYANIDSVELHTEVTGKPLLGYEGYDLGSIMTSPVWKF